jgi:adenylate cyclase
VSPGSKRRVWLFCRVVIASAMIGIAYGSLIGTLVRGSAVGGGLIGAIHGLIIGSVIGSMEIFGARTRLGHAIERAPFLVTLAVKGIIYGAVIGLIQGGNVGPRILALRPAAPFWSPVVLQGLVFSVVTMLGFVFMLKISQLVGGRTLRDLVLGRYHRPRAEERFFLFVDLAGSTALAERAGPAAVHRFLRRVFSIAADPIDDHRGEIYQYVGDEVVITWLVADGRVNARPIGCFFAIEAALGREASDFERDYGTVPRLRAALHAGPVIAGEVGDTKREIVFHGDVVNTASRLEQASRDLERQFVISAEALSRLRGAERYRLEDLGARALRGRAGSIHIFAVQAATR